MVVVIVIIVFIFIVLIGIHNDLISSRDKVAEALSGIDVQLKKRYDLIPNLISTAKNYMKHEENILLEITSLRTKAVNNDLSQKEELDLNNQLSKKLQSLNVMVENYPELKADTSFDNVQRSLNEVESQISAARRAYNANVRQYNSKLEHFPSSIIANFKGLKKYNFFTIESHEKENIDVDELFKK